MRCSWTVRWLISMFLLQMQLVVAKKTWMRNDSLECWVIACFAANTMLAEKFSLRFLQSAAYMGHMPVFVILAFFTMIAYPAYVLYCEKRDERNDDWNANYVPEYPRVRWHLDEYMLEEELKSKSLPNALTTNHRDALMERNIASADSKMTEMKVNELNHSLDKGNDAKLPQKTPELNGKKMESSRKELQTTDKKMEAPKKKVQSKEQKTEVPKKKTELTEKKMGTWGKVANLFGKKKEPQMGKAESLRKTEKPTQKKANTPLKSAKGKLDVVESTRKKTDSSEIIEESSTQNDESTVSR